MALVEAPRATTLINPRSLFARAVIVVMWVFHDKSELIVTPKYRNEGVDVSTTSPSLFVGRKKARFLVNVHYFCFRWIE